MRWYEDELDIVGVPEGVSIMIAGTLENGLLKINVEFYEGDNAVVTVTEFSKVVRMTGEHLINDEIREKFWDKILKVRARHEHLSYKEWRDYITLKMGII